MQEQNMQKAIDPNAPAAEGKEMPVRSYKSREGSVKVAAPKRTDANLTALVRNSLGIVGQIDPKENAEHFSIHPTDGEIIELLCVTYQMSEDTVERRLRDLVKGLDS